MNLGILNRTVKKYTLAEMYLQAAFDIIVSLGLPHELANVCYEFGLYHLEINDKVKAKKYLDRAYGLFSKIGAKKHYIQTFYDYVK